MESETANQIRAAVREAYGAVASRVELDRRGSITSYAPRRPDACECGIGLC